jgi:uncharacterized protein (TIGR04255 family)
MNFPDAPRVRFLREPLAEVICQVRFAPVLRIEREPAGFQERVRASFPSYEARHVSSFQFSAGIPLISMGAPAQQTEHLFGRPNGKVVLARDFVSVDTEEYPGWADVLADVTWVAQATQAEFAPIQVTRVGLR